MFLWLFPDLINEHCRSLYSARLICLLFATCARSKACTLLNSLKWKLIPWLITSKKPVIFGLAMSLGSGPLTQSGICPSPRHPISSATGKCPPMMQYTREVGLVSSLRSSCFFSRVTVMIIFFKRILAACHCYCHRTKPLKFHRKGCVTLTHQQQMQSGRSRQ